MYDCLPMYHTAGGLVATGSVLLNGGSVVIREKFSAREFWDDVVRYECTLFQYIGELCRYLVHSPPNPNETRHRLRIACGNGLRPDLWEEFKTRFRIPHILEFYGATEGNVNIFNFEGKPGAVGRVPWFVAHRFPIAVVRFDVERQQPVRNAEGFCERCDANEPGEVIGRIVNDPERPGNRFEGYAAANQNENKVLHDVFEKGDAWFRTGDLMRKDERGYFYFVDRVGDTFRWKGENVSTSEVAEAINTFPGIADANVYGVTVVGRDGRAGMAAIVCEGQCDLAALHAHLRRQPAGLRAAAVPAHPGPDRRDRHVQAEEGRSRARGLQPGGDQRPDLFQRPAGQGLRAARPGALPAHRERQTSGCDRLTRIRAGVLARGRSGQMVQEGHCVRRRHPRALSGNLRGGRRRKAFRLGADRRRRAGARHRARSIPAQHVPRRRAHLRRRSAGPRGRRPRARARLRPAGAARPTGSSSICRSSIPSCWPIRSDAARWLPRPATPTF